MKRLIPILVIVFMLIALPGCDKGISNTEPSPTNLLDYLDSVVSPGGFVSHELDNGTLSKDEYRLRRVFNSLSMYKEEKDNQFEVETGHIKKYGIDCFSRHDDWYWFINIEDMATVFKNQDFQQDYFNRYGYNLSIDAYYLPLNSLMEKCNVDTGPISLIVWEDDYNLNVCVSGYSDQVLFAYNMYYTQKVIDLKALMEFYAGVDGQDFNSAVSGNETLVYYVSTDEGSVFFEDVGMYTDIIVTAYIWQQDNVICVMAWPGEFSEENLDLCVLEKHEI